MASPKQDYWRKNSSREDWKSMAISRANGFWKHDSRSICFSLVVDNFGVKYIGEDNTNHLIQVLEEHYNISKDWKGTKYCGLSLDWDYKKREVHLSMPGYVEKALARFKHAKSTKEQDQPHKHVIPTYGANV